MAVSVSRVPFAMNAPKPSFEGERAADGGPLQPTKLFIGGITRHTTTKQLRDHFSRYGRVLDCVAMRLADGRPRGFGYVTLDSPLAAERCLAEPQIIDSRVVDMKRAVPEGSGSPAGSPTSMADLRMGMPYMTPAPYYWEAYQPQPIMPPGMMPGMTPPASPSWFAPMQHSQPKASSDSLDCVELLSRRAMSAFASSTHGASALLCEPRAAGAGGYADDANTAVESGPPGLLSPSAPVFVPKEAQPSATRPAPALGFSSPASGTRKAAGKPHARMPLGDVTNTNWVANSGNTLKEAASEKAPMKAGLGLARSTPPGLVGTAGGLGLLGSENMTPAMVATGELKAIMKDRPAPGLPLEIKEDSDCSQMGDDSISNTCEIPEDLPEVREEQKTTEKRDTEVATVEDAEHTEAAHPKEEATGTKSDDASSEGTSEGDESGEDATEAEAAFDGPLPSIGSAEHASGNCRRCNFFPKGRCQNGQNCSFCHLPHDKLKPSRREKRERRAAWLALHGLSAETGDEDGEVDSDTEAQQTVAYSVLPGMPPIRATKLPAPLTLPGTVEASATDARPQGFPRLPPGLPPPGMHHWQPKEESEVRPSFYGLSLPPQPILATVPSAPRQVGSAPQSLAPTPTAGMSRVAATFGLTHQAAAMLAGPNTAPTTPAGEASISLSRESGTQTDVNADDEHTWTREELLKLREPALQAAAPGSVWENGAGAPFTIDYAAGGTDKTEEN